MNIEPRPKKPSVDPITGQPLTPDRPQRYRQMMAFCVRCSDHTKHTSEHDEDEISWFCDCGSLHSTMTRFPKARVPPQFKRPTMTKEQMRAEIEAAMAGLKKGEHFGKYSP